MSVLELFHIPPGLNAEELEQYLREHGDKVCNPRARMPS